MISSWLYVSENLICLHQKLEVEKIVKFSTGKNRMRDLTGMLIFSGAHFAQFLEGPPSCIEQVKREIVGDERHHNLITLTSKLGVERRYAGWSLAYSGFATYVDRSLREAADGNDGDKLLLIMEEFVPRLN